MSLVLVLVAAGAATFLVYALAIRPWCLRWGASRRECAKSLSGDNLVPDANSSATRAISIAAPPECVWPWVAQIGQARGGFYSYAWLENLFGCEIRNADQIHAEWQDIKVGEPIWLHPKIPGIPVAIVEKNHALVLGGRGIPERRIPTVSWAFIVEPAAKGQSRLLVRWRSQTPRTWFDLLFNKYLLEPIHFVMERRMMLGIRDRAQA